MCQCTSEQRSSMLTSTDNHALPLSVLGECRPADCDRNPTSLARDPRQSAGQRYQHAGLRVVRVLRWSGPAARASRRSCALLNRLDEPTAGTVLLDGEDYREITPRVLRLSRGMVIADGIPLSRNRRRKTSPLARARDTRPCLPMRFARCWKRVGFARLSRPRREHTVGRRGSRVSLAVHWRNSPEVLSWTSRPRRLDAVAARGIEEPCPEHRPRATDDMPDDHTRNVQAHRIADPRHASECRRSEGHRPRRGGCWMLSELLSRLDRSVLIGWRMQAPRRLRAWRSCCSAVGSWFVRSAKR